MSQSISKPARDHGNRMSTGSMKKTPATITPKSDVKKEVLSTPKRSTRVQHQHSMTLTPATATTAIDTTTPALAKLGKMVIEHLPQFGGENQPDTEFRGISTEIYGRSTELYGRSTELYGKES